MSSRANGGGAAAAANDGSWRNTPARDSWLPQQSLAVVARRSVGNEMAGVQERTYATDMFRNANA